MKYYAFKPGVLRYFGLPPKILLIMKLIVVILTTFLMQVSAAGLAQKITYTQKNASLEQVFDEITKQTGYNVLWPGTRLNTAQKVQANFKNANLEDVLNKVLANLPMSFTIDTKTIVISEKAPSFLERVVATLVGIDVSGRIVDADGRGLPGASVSVKGKGGKAVSTGANGSFYLKGVNEDAVLVVSFIGYVPKEIKAAKELGDVVLELSTSKLDEVQVIAYGTTTQRLSTGNVTTIKADVIDKQPVNNPLLALQGRVPGLFIEQATGFAGTGVKVRIQGQNSLNYGRDPLYVIDGVPYISQLPLGSNPILGQSGVDVNNSGVSGNPLSFINPSDIESIDILKDADATSIYGSRAANGAILITTKRGKAGDTKIDLNLQSGSGKVPRRLKLMDSQQYLEMRREALRNDGISEPAQGPYGDNDLNGNWDATRSTDWQKELIGGTARYHDFNASVSGGGERTTFLIGTGYHKETNVFSGDFADQKASVRFNINNTSANQKFNIQFTGSYLFDNNQLPTGDLTRTAITLSPVAPPLYKSDGSINWETDEFGKSRFASNPIGFFANKFLNQTKNLIGNMVMSYQLLPGLKLQSSMGYNSLDGIITINSPLDAYYPELRQYLTRATSFTDNKMNSWIIEPQVSYLRNIGKGKLDVLVGSTILQNKSKGSNLIASGFSNDLVMNDIVSASSLQAGSSFFSVSKYNALFGKINYNWLDKYIINLTGRRDGSSRFGPKSQFHNFAAIGGVWIFSNEKMIQDHLQFLSFGKLRGSYGTTGSDQIGDYKTLSLYSAVSQNIPYQGISIYRPNGLVNPYLQWEETKKLTFALDLGFLKDRILLNVSYYRNQSSNQLQQYVLPVTTGAGSITRNQAFTIRNTGWELMLSAANFRSTNFNWTSSINVTIPKTLFVSYPKVAESSAAATAIIGAPLSSQRLYHFLGVDPASGRYQFADKNGNPTFTPVYEDMNIIMDMAPKFYGGVQNTFIYKSLQLDVLFSFVKQIAQGYSFGNGFVGGFYGGSQNQLASLSERWKKPGDIAQIQKVSTSFDNQSLADVYLSDGSWGDAAYIRLKNVSLSWRLPKTWTKVVRLKNLDIFAQGQNLLTITGYSGLDPETKSSSSLPPLRVIVFGVKASL